MAASGTGDSLSTKVLMLVLGGLWVAVAGSYFAQGAKIDALVREQAETKDIAGQALRATVRIEGRLKTMDDADDLRATNERTVSAQRITELENDRDAGRSNDPTGSTPRVIIPLPPAQREPR